MKKMSGGICPECSNDLVYCMSTQDAWDYKSGHYTIDRQIIICSNEKCDFVNEDEE